MTAILVSDLSVQPGEASRQLGVFIDRIAGLTVEELRELYDETFGSDQATIGPLVAQLVRNRTSSRDAGAALISLGPLLDRLDSERNPHAHVVRSICCLLARARITSPGGIRPRTSPRADRR